MFEYLVQGQSIDTSTTSCFLSWIMERKSRTPSLVSLCSYLFICYN